MHESHHKMYNSVNATYKFKNPDESPGLLEYAKVGWWCKLGENKDDYNVHGNLWRQAKKERYRCTTSNISINL